MSTASVALSPIQRPFDITSGGHPSHLGHNGKESIRIFLAVSGSVIPLHVLESESVASVKLRIQRHKGFFVSNHKLVFDGRELSRNDSPVLDYGVTDGTLLHLAIRLSDLQAISVRSVSGKEYECHIDRNRNVGYLKKQIAESGKGIFNVKDQALVCDGEVLEDQRLIHEYRRNSSCDDDSVIHLLVQKSVKVGAQPVGKEFEVSVEAAASSSVDENVVEKKTEIKLTVDPVINKRRVGVVEKKNFEDCLLKPLIVNPRIENPLVIRKLVESTSRGLFSGKQPIRSCEGSGGVYFMLDSSGQEFVSIFKPVDEEPMAVNNPKGLPCSKDGEGLKKGTSVGEGALREVAAYILDHPKNGPRLLLASGEEVEGYVGVPPTTMVKCLHKGFYHPRGYESSWKKNSKIGSLQMYVRNIGSCEEMGPGAFPVEEVHKICVLDIRLANTDRHAGNILVSRDDQGGKIKLIPIDHGYCLPKQFEDCTFDWLYWAQAHQPFSGETRDYINSLDAEQDIKLLKLHGWDVPLECKLILQISTMLLKKGANRGLSPFTIGSMMCRETLKKESKIEQIMNEARREAYPLCSTDDESAFLERVSILMEQELDQI